MCCMQPVTAGKKKKKIKLSNAVSTLKGSETALKVWMKLKAAANRCLEDIFLLFLKLFSLILSKMAQEETPSWLNYQERYGRSQESKEGADPEAVPNIEDYSSARLQLLLFTSSGSASTMFLSPTPVHSLFFRGPFLILVFSLHATAIASHQPSHMHSQG